MVLTTGRPFRPRLTPIRPRRPSEATGPPDDGDGEPVTFETVERELTSVIDRLKRLREAIRADDLAPLPAVYEDGEGES